MANQPETPVYGPCRVITVVGSNAAQASALPPNSLAMVSALFPAFG
ncbi:esterase domain protein [Mycobacterium kansasii]|uniref:Esterase domain protein n=1 Tax=Mycobacterium kansasii TaxID=1768 RepID=A0A1V3WJE2_MYCKA|nr:esterase domain protein [Mycobacterium kansasii]